MNTTQAGGVCDSFKERNSGLFEEQRLSLTLQFLFFSILPLLHPVGQLPRPISSFQTTFLPVPYFPGQRPSPQLGSSLLHAWGALPSLTYLLVITFTFSIPVLHPFGISLLILLSHFCDLFIPISLQLVFIEHLLYARRHFSRYQRFNVEQDGQEKSCLPGTYMQVKTRVQTLSWKGSPYLSLPFPSLLLLFHRPPELGSPSPTLISHLSFLPALSPGIHLLKSPGLHTRSTLLYQQDTWSIIHLFYGFLFFSQPHGKILSF